MVLKLFLFYIALTTWYGWKRYLDMQEPSSRRDIIRKKRIELREDKIVSEVYVLTGQDRDGIREEMRNFTFWGTILCSWFIVPITTFVRIKNFFLYYYLVVNRKLRRIK